MSKRFIVIIKILMIVLLIVPAMADVVWQNALDAAAFSKVGSAKLNATEYQYSHIGLAGMVLRVGPHGFTSPGAPNVYEPAALGYYPFLAQQYWWGDLRNTQRQEPFEITGGYGTVSGGSISAADAGTINPSTFSQILNMNGTLDIDLDLTVGSDTLSSQRTEFVTPNGVWVVRITDVDSSRPFVLQVTPKMSYAFSAQAKTGGMVITATKSGAATAGLAIAGDNINVINTTTNFRVTSNIANQTVTFFIAPTSSYDPAVTNPANDAWSRASAAKANGYANELQATLNWWANYNSKSTINLPASADNLEKWYIRSMYYHGVFFGKSIIPPGLWGWSSVPAGGAACPEFDLTFSQLALLYSNHIEESANIIDWLEATLPRARLNALGTTLYTCSIHHNDGAKYGWWVGYDGQYADPSAEYCGNLYSNYPNGNCATMAVKHADFTLDPAYTDLAELILFETTQVMVDDQAWNSYWNGYLDIHRPNDMQQASCVFGLSQSVARGIQENPGWNSMLPWVIINKGLFRGQECIVGGPGAIPESGGYYGDAPLLHSVWWYGVVNKNDPVVRPTFEMVSLSGTRNYTFNRGTMSVAASKLYDPNEALRWAQDLINSDVLHDDMSISEMVWDVHDFKRCPEIAAHGAVMTSTIEMLIDPDNTLIEVFPAIPASWWTDGVSFTNMAVKGAILVDGNINGNSITINLANTNSAPTSRNLRVWLPPDTTELFQSPPGTVVANGCAALSVTIPANSNQDYLFMLPFYYCAEFLPSDINKDCYVDMRDFAILAENWLRVVP